MVVVVVVVAAVVAASGAVNVICCVINNNAYLWWERLPLVVAYAIAAGLVSCSLHGRSLLCLTSLKKRRLSEMVIVGRSKSFRISDHG